MYDGVESEDWMQSSNDHEAPDELVTIRRFGNMSEALLAQGCLDSAGVECFLADTNVSRLEWPITRGLRLQVKAEDAETAAALLEQSPVDESNV
jgi:hypothetical protein